MATIGQTKSGNYYYRVYLREDGKKTSKYKSGFKTKRAAERAARKIELFLDEGYKLSGENIVFSEHMQTWFELYKKGKNSIDNDKDIQFACNRVNDYFGLTKLRDISRDSYQGFLNWYGNDHATASVSKVHTYAKMCLQDAVHDGILTKDPTYRVVVKGKNEEKPTEEKYLNQSEAILLKNYIKETWKPEHASKTMILLGLASGVRFSEALGLTWDDIDFKNKTINITKSFDYKNTLNFKPTKNKSSIRKIKIDDETINYLKRWRIYQAEWFLKTGIRNKLNLVFYTVQGKALSNNAPTNVLRTASQKLGIQRITFHGLRHTHISILLYHDVSIYSVSKRAGHSSTVITQRVYAHVIKELEEKDEDKILEVLAAMS
ncbi:tyrosine-type recombinase/integrase [Jeotgalibaca porci]|uniref:tyrosine-type recombinase/integrase n=1 Tax=Jeotgalibaca porci TaxID=1868793 RepID=UPI0035A011E6